MMSFLRGIGGTVMYLGPQSTASKIINGIEEKYHKKHYLSMRGVYEEKQVIQSLAKAIENVIDYPAYQVLEKNNKNKIRNKIIEKLYERGMEFSKIYRDYKNKFDDKYGMIVNYRDGCDAFPFYGLQFPKDLFYPDNGDTSVLENAIQETLRDEYSGILLSTPKAQMKFEL